MLMPPNLKMPNYGFQIDVYSFHRNNPKEGLIYFPWDEVIFTVDDFFPIVKHKPIVSKYHSEEEVVAAMNNNTFQKNNANYYHMPFNVPCLLSKMYGDDFMTPKQGSGTKGHGTQDITNAYSNTSSTWCKNIEVSGISQQEELKKQLSGNWTSLSSLLDQR